MIEMQWKGFDITNLEHEIHAIIDEIEHDVRQILDDITREAVADMQRIIESTTSKTGEARQAAGQGFAGRIDTGRMRDDVARALETDMDGAVVGTWGWVYNLDEYYLAQEHGTRSIGAMSALQGSYVAAREKLRDRLRDMGLEVS